MKYQCFNDCTMFYNEVFEILSKCVTQNLLVLGNVILGKEGGELVGWRNTANWFMAVVKDDKDKVILTAIMTPPFNITLFETDNIEDNDALDYLCENIIKDGISIVGVTSENNLAKRFSEIYTKKLGQTYEVKERLRIYELTEVSNDILKIGNIRKATESDMHFLPYWFLNFQSECNLAIREIDEVIFEVKRAISKGVLYVLEDEGMPVTMAGFGRTVLNNQCVGWVYTPAYFRKKGYASSCVAQISQISLDNGYKYTSLFTDLANPISNSIYQKIGYKPVCDNLEIKFKN